MSTNTLAQGRSWYTEHDFAFSPDPSSDLYRNSKRWLIELEREVMSEPGIEPPKEFAFNPTQPTPRTYNVGVNRTDILSTVTPAEFTLISTGVPTGMTVTNVDGKITLAGTPTAAQTSRVAVAINAEGYNPGTLYCDVTTELYQFQPTPATPNPVTLTWDTPVSNLSVISVDTDFFTVESTGLPAGITATRDINAVVLNGRSTATGSYTASITISATNYEPMTFPLSITVGADTRTFIPFSPDPIPNVTITYGATADTLIMTLGVDDVDTSAPPLPDGLAYAEVGRELRLRGVPSAVGQTTMSVNATKIGYKDTSLSYELIVAPARIVFTPDELPALPGLTVGVAADVLLTTLDTPFNFTSSPGLPDGLSLSKVNNTLRLVGTPTTAGAFSETITFTATGHMPAIRVLTGEVGQTV